MKHLKADDFMAMDDYVDDHPIRVYLAYAHDKPPNIFGKIYREGAKLWAWKPLGQATLAAAQYLYDTHGLYLRLYDCLRTVDAQQAMLETEISKANPSWFEEPRVLSPPGQGAHPRGMAIDLEPMREDGTLLDMGTVFDHLAEDAGPDKNPAHRAYAHMRDEVRANREILNTAMRSGAKAAGIDLDLLDTEWWDFRLPASFNEQYAPLSDADLPPDMRMVQT